MLPAESSAWAVAQAKRTDASSPQRIARSTAVFANERLQFSTTAMTKWRLDKALPRCQGTFSRTAAMERYVPYNLWLDRVPDAKNIAESIESYEELNPHFIARFDDFFGVRARVLDLEQCGPDAASAT